MGRRCRTIWPNTAMRKGAFRIRDVQVRLEAGYNQCYHGKQLHISFERMPQVKNYMKRLAIYVAGLLILAFGVAFSIRSKLGVSPVSSLPATLNLITGLSVGTLTFIFFSICVFGQFLMLRKDFKIKHLMQIAFSSVFAFFVDFAMASTASILPGSYPVKLMLLLSSLVLIGIGVFLLVLTDIVYNAPEGFCKVYADRYHLEFSFVKSRFDISCVLLSVVLALVFLGNLGLIREGTVIAALSIGKIVGFLMRRFGKKVTLLYT